LLILPGKKCFFPCQSFFSLNAAASQGEVFRFDLGLAVVLLLLLLLLL
jgi:hypothetical protein